MGFKYQGDSTIGVSLTVQTPKPLDTRLVVDTRADLYSIPAKYAYNGMPVVCVADGNIYTLIDKNKIKEAIGWKASYEAIQIITCTEQEYKNGRIILIQILLQKMIVKLGYIRIHIIIYMKRV